MKGVITQPYIAPNVHLIARFAWADRAILMNKAQYTRKYKLSGIQLPKKSLGIPVKKTKGFTSCLEKEIDLSSFETEFFRTIENDYGEEAYRCKAIPFFHLLQTSPNFARASAVALQFALNQLKIETVKIASDMPIEPVFNDPCGWILKICKHFEIDQYMSGATVSKEYMEEDLCKKQGVDLVFQDWKAPEDGNYSWLHYWFSGKLNELKRSI